MKRWGERRIIKWVSGALCSAPQPNTTPPVFPWVASRSSFLTCATAAATSLAVWSLKWTEWNVESESSPLNDVCFPGGTYRSTVRSNRQWGGVWSIVQLQEVVLAISGVIDTDLGKGDGHHTTPGCRDDPFTVSTVGIGAWVVWTWEWAVVSIQNATTT